MTLKNLLFLPVLLVSATVYANEKPEFDIDGLKIGDELTEEFSEQYCRNRASEKREVECKRKQKIDGVPVSVLYLFYDASLVTVSLSFDSEAFPKLVRVYEDKYLDFPYDEIEEPVVLGDGMKYTNKKVLWATTSGDFVIEKYGHNLTEGYAHLDSQKYNKYVNKKKIQRGGGKLASLFSELFVWEVVFE
jgi:hypothetical protein